MVKPRIFKVSNRAAMVGRFLEVSPGDLSPAARRTRKHPAQKRRALLESIRTQGIISPIIVNSRNVIVDGHLRVEIAVQLQLRTVPVLRVEYLSDAELRAFGIAANRMPANADWDMDELRLELEEIKADDVALDLSLTGFSIGEIDRIVGNHLAAKYDDLDATDDPPLGSSPGARLGDHYSLGDHELICGDATDRAVIERLMHGDQAQVVFTDPPYNVPINGHVSSSGQHAEFAMASGEMSSGEFTGFLELTLGNMGSALASGAIAFVCMDHAHIGELLEAGTSVFDHRLNICVWDKGQGGMGALYRSQHELVVVFKKGDAPHRNNIELGKNGRNRTNVWSFPGMVGFSAGRKKALELHPTVKPVALIAEALLDVTAPSDLVLDAFGGSGSTLIAAEKTGRRARLVELDPRYVDRIIGRWEKLTGRTAELLHRVAD
ncbi:MAG TPA: DNA methyltransferase [Novosphingobium sp.]|nr:DNA methyltransferase [Novosphingobium sp.]